MNRSGGFARTSKYAVIITPPASLSRLADERTAGAGAAGGARNSLAEKITNTNAAIEIIYEGNEGDWEEIETQ